jgi:hypothetical protein
LERKIVLVVRPPTAVTKFVLVAEVVVEGEAVARRKHEGLPIFLIEGDFFGILLSAGPHASIAVQLIDFSVAADPQAFARRERDEVGIFQRMLVHCAPVKLLCAHRTGRSRRPVPRFARGAFQT